MVISMVSASCHAVRRLVPWLLTLAASAVPSFSVTIYVDAAKPCPGTGTAGSPYCEIQSAICHGAAGDLVSVAPGTYAESVRMRPGVSVVSMGGSTVTTIDATGKACIQGASSPPDPVNDYCAPLAGSTQCSAVVFGSSFLNADRLDGFKIRGGRGINRVENLKIAGGGIFSLSSPTISNNLITGNTLAGPQSYYAGGGIYLNEVSSATPVITRNTIDGNHAVPVAGSSLGDTYGAGGGIYSGTRAHPTINQNVITNNAAGDLNLAFTTGAGGGIAVYGFGSPATVMTRNLIAGNTAESDGAGIYVGNNAPSEPHPIASITNSEIRGNRAGRRGGGISTYYASATIVNNALVSNQAVNGGGISTYYASATIVNNTLVSNQAVNGGGIYVSRGSMGDPVTISNNILSANTASDPMKGGGGLYVSVTLPLTPLSIRNNDFWTNLPTGKQVGGARNDSNTIGVDGNLQVNPAFVSVPGNDYHLTAGSGVIDRGNNADASSISGDADGRARIQDGDLDCTAIVDMGEYEYPAPDSDGDGTIDCDDPCPLDALNDQDSDGICAGNAFHPPKIGKNDNCPTVANTNQLNADNDAMGDVCDPCPLDALNDQDGDGICVGNAFNPPKTGKNDNCPTVANANQTNTDGDARGDACDCAPTNSTVFAAPIEVSGVTLHSLPATQISWSSQSSSAGSSTTYDIATGSVATLRTPARFGPGTCLASDVTAPPSNDTRPPPAPGGAFYYLVRAQNLCGGGTYGSAPADAHGSTGGACP